MMILLQELPELIGSNYSKREMDGVSVCIRVMQKKNLFFYFFFFGYPCTFFFIFVFVYIFITARTYDCVDFDFCYSIVLYVLVDSILPAIKTKNGPACHF